MFNLWHLATEKIREKELDDKGDESEEKNLIFVGSRESVSFFILLKTYDKIFIFFIKGKSSIILNYTDR